MTTNVGWTAQSSHGWVHDEGTPGNTFTEDQLPHPEVQRAAGINPDLYRNAHGLWVEPAEGPLPVFTGTETGLDPVEGVRQTGNVESYMSSIPAPEVEDEAVSEEEPVVEDEDSK